MARYDKDTLTSWVLNNTENMLAEVENNTGLSRDDFKSDAVWIRAVLNTQASGGKQAKRQRSSQRTAPRVQKRTSDRQPDSFQDTSWHDWFDMAREQLPSWMATPLLTIMERLSMAEMGILLGGGTIVLRYAQKRKNKQTWKQFVSGVTAKEAAALGILIIAGVKYLFDREGSEEVLIIEGDEWDMEDEEDENVIVIEPEEVVEEPVRVVIEDDQYQLAAQLKQLQQELNELKAAPTAKPVRRIVQQGQAQKKGKSGWE